MIAGFVTALVMGPDFLANPFGIPHNVAGLVANISVFFLVHFLTRNKTPQGAFVPEEI